MAIPIKDIDIVRAYDCYSECIGNFWKTEPPPAACVDTQGKVKNPLPPGCETWNARLRAEINRCKKSCGIDIIVGSPLPEIANVKMTSSQLSALRYASNSNELRKVEEELPYLSYSFQQVGGGWRDRIPRKPPPRIPRPGNAQTHQDCIQQASQWYFNHPDRLRFEKCKALSNAWLKCMQGCPADDELCQIGCSVKRDTQQPSSDECNILSKLVENLLADYLDLVAECDRLFGGGQGGGGGGGPILAIVNYPYRPDTIDVNDPTL